MSSSVDGSEKSRGKKPAKGAESWVQLGLINNEPPGESAIPPTPASETTNQLASPAQQATPPLVPSAKGWRLDPKTSARAWLNSRRSKAYRAHSLDQYLSMVGAAATWWTEKGSGADLLTATADDVLSFLESRGRGDPPTLSPTTGKRYLGLLSDVFDHLLESGWRTDNPVPALLRQPHLGSPTRAAPAYLQHDLAEQYIQWVKSQPQTSWRDRRDLALRLIFLATGITLEEAKQLSPQDVYLGANEPGIQVAGHHRVQARRVPIGAWAIPELQAWTDERTLRADRIGVTEKTGPYFPANSTLGLTLKPNDAPPLSSTEVYEIIRPGMEHVLGAEAARLGAQTLRNTFAVRQMKDGATDDTIMRWLGLQTTFTLAALRRQIAIHAGERVV